jgi:hypothetical protein
MILNALKWMSNALASFKHFSASFRSCWDVSCAISCAVLATILHPNLKACLVEPPQLHSFQALWQGHMGPAASASRLQRRSSQSPSRVFTRIIIIAIIIERRPRTDRKPKKSAKARK